MHTLAQITSGQLQKGTPIQGLTAQVVKAYPIKSGQHQQYGSWTRMDMRLQDASGVCDCSWWEPSVQSPEQIEGRQIQINFYTNNQGQPVGAQVDSYFSQQNNQTVYKLKVRGRAVSVVGGAPQQQPQQSQPPQQQPPQQQAPAAQWPQQQAAAPTPANAPTPGQPLVDDSVMMRASRVWWSQFEGMVPGDAPNRADVIQDLVSTMIIAVARDGLAISQATRSAGAGSGAAGSGAPPRQQPQQQQPQQQDDGDDIPF